MDTFMAVLQRALLPAFGLVAIVCASGLTISTISMDLLLRDTLPLHVSKSWKTLTHPYLFCALVILTSCYLIIAGINQEATLLEGAVAIGVIVFSIKRLMISQNFIQESYEYVLRESEDRRPGKE